MFDLRHFIHDVETTLVRQNLGLPGVYRQGPTKTGSLLKASQAAGESPVVKTGAAPSAAHILYTINRFPGEITERQAWIQALQSLQDPETGLCPLDGFHPVASTAWTVSALALFDTRVRHSLVELEPLKKLHALAEYLDLLNWRDQPLTEALRGSGVYTTLVFSGEVSLDWEERYFTWLWEASDPNTGLLREGRIRPKDENGLTPYLAGTFCYLTTLEYARRPLRYPDKLVETCLDLFETSGSTLGEQLSIHELAWVYCLNRAARQSGHRYVEARQALQSFAERYIPFLMDVDSENDPTFNQLFILSAVVDCLAELQISIPGLIYTTRPLRSSIQ